MQYWINHNGVQSGPVELDDLKKLGLTSSAYVWYEGLSDWVKITEVADLKDYYDLPAETAETLETAEPMTADDAQAEPTTMATPPPIPAQETVQAAEQQPQQPQQMPAAAEPCPPTNMVWAIISTVLCCLPLGIVAIVFATQVTNKYRQGDIEGAKRASETAAWLCIATIVLGIISYPFVSMIQMMAISK